MRGGTAPDGSVRGGKALITPLLSGSTYRRGVYLLLGAVILLPYVLLGTAFAQMLNSTEVPRAATIMLLVITIVIGVIPSMPSGARAPEIAAVRSLLDVDLPDPAPNADLETRLRGALWFGVHMIAAGIVGLALLIAVPLAVAYLAPRVGLAGLIIAAVLLLAVVYAIAGMGKLAAVMAPVLLGPSTSERIAALEAKADELAERNRLARELHDSVGHALTVTTVQAAAARRVLASDPDFAAKALEAIEETGRSATEDLDHVLGLLQKPAYVVPNKSLRELEKLSVFPGSSFAICTKAARSGRERPLAPSRSWARS